METCGFNFNVINLDIDESFSKDMNAYDVARHLAERKAAAYSFKEANEVVIAADTVVIFENEILGKPENRKEAIAILKKLSGQTHDVVTGVCIRDHEKQLVFDDLTSVTFKNIAEEKIIFYIDNFHPFDKAGSYGAQDWWGLVAIEKLVGSYFNVMGLPTHKVYQELKNF